jgi:phenylacetate-CoA ligase
MRVPLHQRVAEPLEEEGGLAVRDWLLSAALWCGRTLAGGLFTSSMREMEAAQWLAPEELARRNEQKLGRLLRHAADNVPFYRDLGFRAGGGAFEDLRRLPILNKAAYRSQLPEKFYAANVPAYWRVERSTSGSTGQPFRFCMDRRALPAVLASHLFYDSWVGLRPFDRYLRIVAPPAAVGPPPRGAPLAVRLRQAATRQLQATYERWTQEKVLVWEVDAGRAEEVWRRIEAFRPAFVLGYTSTVATLADELSRRGLVLSRRVRGVITIAETLTPARRRAIEDYFRAPITNRYGLREFGSWSAQSCPVSPDLFHVNTELVVCEVVRADGSPAAPGETGRVVLTDLMNYARPFIRYDTGDLAVCGGKRCECGRGFPLLGPIDGRSQECLRTPSGKVISPAVLGHYLFVFNSHLDSVLQYQLLHEAPDRARLLIVAAAEVDESRIEQLRDDLARLLGPDMQVDVTAVAAISAEPSGKRPIIKVLWS